MADPSIKKASNTYLRLIWEALTLGQSTLWRATADNPGIGYDEGDYLREVFNLATGGSSWFRNGTPISPPPITERELASGSPQQATQQSLGAPIPDASFVVSTPQIGDDEEGEVDGVWHPAIDQFVFSANPLDLNGIPLEAQSVLMILRLPDPIFALNTEKAWDLKNIAGYARLDEGTPDLLGTADKIRGFPLGGVYGKAWINRANALALKAISRWIPETGQSQPYPNYRLIAECSFYREAPPQPIFEHSLIVAGIGANVPSTPVVTGTGLSIGDGDEVLLIGDNDQTLGLI